jgi:cytochrome c
MRRLLLWSVVLLVFGLAPSIDAVAADRATGQEAKAMVERAAALLEKVGPEKAFAAFMDPANKEFHDRDLYVFVRSMDGNTVAHGVNKAMIGHTSLDSKDADGKLYNKEIMETATAKGSGWVDYRWPNPVDKKIEQKSSYVQKAGDYVIGAGFYK